MKKILVSALAALTVFACSTIKVDIPNFAIRSAINSKINVETDLKVTKITPNLTDVYVKDNKLNLDVEVLANSFGKTANISLTVQTDLEYMDGKLYTKDVKITKINSLGDDSLFRSSISRLVQTIFSNTEIFDVRSKSINPTLVKNIYIGNSNVVVEI